jgi:hypothetical protein
MNKFCLDFIVTDVAMG